MGKNLQKRHTPWAPRKGERIGPVSERTGFAIVMVVVIIVLLITFHVL